jgi:hypothetical protein
MGEKMNIWELAFNENFNSDEKLSLYISNIEHFQENVLSAAIVFILTKEIMKSVLKIDGVEEFSLEDLEV